MKKTFFLLTVALALSACVNDDKYDWESDFADKTGTDTLNIKIVYNGSTVSVSGDDYNFVSTNGADVTVKSNTNKFLLLTLSGSTQDGSLLIYSWKKLGVLLNNADITNADGPAINNQCGKSFYLITAEGTTNTLTDGTTYADAPTNDAGETIDQKGALFSEGQIYFGGSGSLTIKGNAKNGIASDDYIIFESGTVNVEVESTGSNGIKVNDGFTITGGTLSINVKADGARGIRNDAFTTIAGGTTTINTSGNCKIETVDGVTDTTSCAGIKCDSLFTMTAGTLTITSSGDSGKGVNCSDTILVKGGNLTAVTTGGKKVGKPKTIKSDKAIVLCGGYFYANSKKSWACDNASESEEPKERVTIIGTPKSETYSKPIVEVIF